VHSEVTGLANMLQGMTQDYSGLANFDDMVYQAKLLEFESFKSVFEGLTESKVTEWYLETLLHDSEVPISDELTIEDRDIYIRMKFRALKTLILSGDSKNGGD